MALINFEDWQNDGWTIVTARALAAAGSFCSNDTGRPTLGAVCIETNEEGTYLSGTDSYKFARIRNRNMTKNPSGRIMVKWSQLKKCRLITAKPKANAMVAIRQFEPSNEYPMGCVRVKVLEPAYVGHELAGSATLDVIEGSFPSWEKLDGHKALIGDKKQSNVGPGLNTSFLISIFKTIELAVSDCGGAITQFVHGGSCMQPIYFHAENASGESIWTIQMPVRI